MALTALLRAGLAFVPPIVPVNGHLVRQHNANESVPSCHGTGENTHTLQDLVPGRPLPCSHLMAMNGNVKNEQTNKQKNPL